MRRDAHLPQGIDEAAFVGGNEFAAESGCDQGRILDDQSSHAVAVEFLNDIPERKSIEPEIAFRPGKRLDNRVVPSVRDLQVIPPDPRDLARPDDGIRGRLRILHGNCQLALCNQNVDGLRVTNSNIEFRIART